MNQSSLAVEFHGELFLEGNPKSKIVGPIKKGLRILMWGKSQTYATSISFILDTDIKLGETKLTNIVVFSPLSLDKSISIGESYNIGMPNLPLGTFRILEKIGEWAGKVP